MNVCNRLISIDVGDFNIHKTFENMMCVNYI